MDSKKSDQIGDERITDTVLQDDLATYYGLEDIIERETGATASPGRKKEPFDAEENESTDAVVETQGETRIESMSADNNIGFNACVNMSADTYVEVKACGNMSADTNVEIKECGNMSADTNVEVKKCGNMSADTNVEPTFKECGNMCADTNVEVKDSGVWKDVMANSRVVLAKRRCRLNSTKSLPDTVKVTDEDLHLTVVKKNLLFASLRYAKGGENTSGENSLNTARTSSNITTGNDSSVFKHENIYRGLVRGLLHPLGAPDSTVGLRPGDLLDHIREVFEVDPEDHELYITEELQNKPQQLQVNVTVLEANGLRGADFSEDSCDPFCLLTIINAGSRGRGSPKLSPRTSPKTSPTASPYVSPQLGFRTKGASLDGAVHQTSIVKNSSHPKWNEEFTLDIDDSVTDELQISICDKLIPSGKSALRNLLSPFKEHTESDGYLGKVTIPVRNISSLGTDDWYDIVSIGTPRKKQKPVGKCHLRLALSYNLDSMEHFAFSNEDYYQAYKQFLNYTFRNPNSNGSRSVGDNYGMLTLKDHRILKMFAETHRISKLSQAIVNVICMLEIQCDVGGADIGEGNLHIALDDLCMTWAAMQVGQKQLLDRMPLTDSEISNYRRVATKYIQQKCDNLTDLPCLFPPAIEHLNTLKSQLGVIVQLLGLDLWEPNCVPQKEIMRKILNKLNKDFSSWLEKEIANITETSPEIKDKVIPEIQRLIDLVDVICSHCTVLPVLKTFYSCLGINYYKVVSFAVEKQISAKCMPKMEEMNKYKKRYSSFSVNIMAAGKLSLRLYFALRKFQTVVKENVSRREVFRLTISHYQEWFVESLIYWLQIFQTECVTRMEKALEIDKDVVVVTSLVKYSHSSVDVLSCFAQVIGEWRKIDFRDPDCALMGVTNVTDIICNGARLYADKIHSILERNCYYDDRLNAEFDVNDRLCITLNNIEHVRLYLEELPQLLAYETVIMMITTRHQSDDVGAQALATLRRLIDMSSGQILQKSCLLLQQIVEKMRGDIERYMEVFTKMAPHKASSIDSILGYVATNMHTFHKQLMPDIYPYMVEHFWNMILRVFDAQLIQGEQPDYYEQMKQHLKAISAFFMRSGMMEKNLHIDPYEDLKNTLNLNSKKSTTLMQMYFQTLATDMVTPTECYGHLAFRVAYMEETRGNVTLFINVLQGTNLPGLDATGYSDPYVEVSLQPSCLFPFTSIQKTPMCKQTLNPVFNTSFQFPNIPKEYMSTKGMCVLLSVFDYDKIGRDDFAGEVIIHLPIVMKIGMDKTLEKMPATILPLKRPKRPITGPFTILNHREWDKEAKKFVSDRLKFIDNQPARTDTAENANQGFFSSIFSSVFT